MSTQLHNSHNRPMENKTISLTVIVETVLFILLSTSLPPSIHSFSTQERVTKIAIKRVIHVQIDQWWNENRTHTCRCPYTYEPWAISREPSPKCVYAADLFKRKCSWLLFVGTKNQNNTIEHYNITYKTFYSNFLFE